MVQAEPAPSLPIVDSDTQPFWDSCKEHRMAIQKCLDCGHFRFPPRPICPECLSSNAEWTPVSRRGKVYTALTMHRAYRPFYEGKIPYNISLIQLEEGPKMWSNVVGCDPKEVKIDMPVELFYEDVTSDFTLPKFRPARGG